MIVHQNAALPIFLINTGCIFSSYYCQVLSFISVGPFGKKVDGGPDRPNTNIYRHLSFAGLLRATGISSKFLSKSDCREIFFSSIFGT